LTLVVVYVGTRCGFALTRIIAMTGVITFVVFKGETAGEVQNRLAEVVGGRLRGGHPPQLLG
jgi:hypothetical protein